MIIPFSWEELRRGDEIMTIWIENGGTKRERVGHGTREKVYDVDKDSKKIMSFMGVCNVTEDVGMKVIIRLNRRQSIWYDVDKHIQKYMSEIKEINKRRHKELEKKLLIERTQHATN